MDDFLKGKSLILVDDDSFFHLALTKLFSRFLPPITLKGAKSFSELQELMSRDHFHLAICDYHLPDSEQGEAIKFLVDNKIPTIVLTGSYEPSVREQCIHLGVADVLLKNIPNLSEMLIYTTKRILKNLHTQVLIVEDSPTSQIIMLRTLRSIGLNVSQAKSIAEAERYLFEDQKFQLILLDYYLEKEAFDLLINLRKRYSKYEVGVIVLSAYVTSLFVPQLLKAGANDFLRKPFLEEELKVRVNNLLDYLDAVQELTFLASHDPLTGLLNRKVFLEKVGEVFHLAKRQGDKIALVMFDLDNFKKLNDTYGHQAGDLILCDFADKLKKCFKRHTDLIARYGGEEFILVCAYDSRENLLSFLSDFKRFVSKNPININEMMVYYTFTAGVELELKDSLEETIRSADAKLYLGKSLGKNCVIS